MNLSPRQHKILNQIRKSGSVQVDALATDFAVTTQTIRRDLSDLCDLGVAVRIHGGARESHSIANVDYEKRRLLAREQKEQIATLVAGLIPDDCSLMMNIGTTTEQVAHSLHSHKNLVVISNNFNIINILMNSHGKELILVGGTVRQSDGAIVGEDAVEFISRYKADYAIIGASALDEDGAILDYDLREVSVARAILHNARVKILVADNRKFSQTATMRIGHISDIDYFVTDQHPSAQFIKSAGKTKIITPESSNEH